MSPIQIAAAQAVAYRQHCKVLRDEGASMTLDRYNALKADLDRVGSLPNSSTLHDHETKLTHVIVDNGNDQIVSVYELNAHDECVLLDYVPDTARAHWEHSLIETGIEKDG